MSILISTAIPTASASVAPQTGGVAKAPDATQNPAANGTANAVAVSQAAVVSLSFSSANRAASRGEGRMVDAAFDKEKTKKKDADGKSDKAAQNQKTVNVEA